MPLYALTISAKLAGAVLFSARMDARRNARLSFRPAMSCGEFEQLAGKVGIVAEQSMALPLDPFAPISLRTN
jgi:hypothetical protein